MADEFEGPGVGSLLQSAITAAPLAVGVGLGIRDVMRKGGLPNVGPKGSSYAEMAKKIRSTVPSTPSMESQLAFMNGLTGDLDRISKSEMGLQELAFRRNVAQRAWEISEGQMDPLLRKNLPYTGSLRKMGDRQVVEYIDQTLRSNTSPAMKKMYYQFRKNYRAIEGEMMRYGDISLSKKIFPQFTGVADMATRASGPLGEPSMTLAEPLGLKGNQAPNAIRGLAKWGNEYKRGFRGGFAHQTWTLGVGGELFSFNMPIAKGGIMVEGSSGQTVRAAPDVMVFNPATRKMTRYQRHEFLLREFERGILPRIQKGELQGPQLKQEISRLYREVIGAQEVLPSTAGAYTTLRSNQADIMVETSIEEMNRQTKRSAGLIGHRPAEEGELRKALEARGEYKFFGGTSPTSLSRSRVSKYDISQLAMTPEAMDWSYRPEQAVRDWELSSQVKAPKHWSQYRTPEAAALFGDKGLPQARVLYVDPDKHAEWLVEHAKIGDGEALALKSFGDQMEWKRRNRIHIDINRARSDLLELYHNKQLQAGMVLGPELATGDLVTLKDNMRIQSIRRFESAQRGEYLTIEFDEVRKMQESEKMFGSLKATTRFAQESTVRGRLLGATKRDMISEGFQVIASMDRLKKSNSLHNEQIITELHHSMMQKFQGRHEDRVVQAFMKDPVQFSRSLARSATAEGVYKHEKMLASLAHLGKRAGLDSETLGRTFASMPTVVGKAKTGSILMEAGFEKQQIRDIFKVAREGFAGGVGEFAYGGPAYENILGSVEPRAFMALKGGALGEFGEQISDDIARRLAVTNPEKVAVHAELGRTLESLTGKFKPGGEVLDLATMRADEIGERFRQFTEAGGGTMRFGKGFADMYVPGADELKALRPYQVGEKQIYSDLYGTYERMAYTGARLHEQTPLSIEQFNKERDVFVRELQKQHAPAGKGMGAIERGKLIGSRFLRGVSEAGTKPITNDLFTVGISKKYAADMFDELAESGLYSSADLQSLRERLFGGGRAGAFVSRHPFIGQYSHQPIMVELLEGTDAPDIVIPERLRTVAGKKITLGPLVGMAGDKDADIFSLMLLGPKEEAAARRAIENADSAFVHNYMQHQVRMSLLKPPKAGASEATTLQKMIGGALQLGTTQRYVPELSIELSRARAAVGSMMTGESRANAEAMLEWLEQTPISAKHLKTEEILSGELGGQLDTLVQAMRDKSAVRLRESMEQLVKGNDTAMDMLKKGIDLSPEDMRQLESAGVKGVRRHIKGIDLEATIKDVMSSLQQFEHTRMGREFDTMAGRAFGMTAQELPEYLAKLSSNTRQGLFASVAEASVAADNMIGRLGKGMAIAAPKLALGFAASIALSSILSSPPESVGSGSALPKAKSNVKYKGAKNLRPEDMHPPSQRLGQPSHPMMLHPSTVMMAPPGASPQVDIRARGSSIINGPGLAERIRQAIGGRTSVDMSVRDDRSSLNNYAYGNRMF